MNAQSFWTKHRWLHSTIFYLNQILYCILKLGFCYIYILPNNATRQTPMKSNTVVEWLVLKSYFIVLRHDTLLYNKTVNKNVFCFIHIACVYWFYSSVERVYDFDTIMRFSAYACILVCTFPFMFLYTFFLNFYFFSIIHTMPLNKY